MVTFENGTYEANKILLKHFLINITMNGTFRKNNSYDLSLIKKTETQRTILLKIRIEGWYSGSFNKMHIKTSDCEFSIV